MNKHSEIIVKHTPKHYPRQEGLTCGETNLRVILESFSIPYSPRDSLRLRIKLFGYSFIQDISDLLETHGLSAPVLHANHHTDEEKIAILTQHIDIDQPVLIAIGNGYLNRGVYTPIARTFIGHFITIYGYSKDDKVFYIYDPYLKGPYPDEISVGNDTRSFNEILRDWRGPFYYKFIGMDHVYIPISFKDY